MARRSLLIVSLALLTLLLLLAGCSGDNQNRPKSKSFVGGTTGLEISMLGAPPAEVFDSDSPFDVSVLVRNSGEYTVPSGKVTMSVIGINPADFGKTSADLTQQSTEDLGGAQLDAQGNTIPGDTTTFEFRDLKYQENVSGSVPFIFRAVACYYYETHAQAQLCLRQDLLGKTGEQGVCDPNKFTMNADNSGAPVQVMMLQQHVAGSKKIEFSFTVKQVDKTPGARISEKSTTCDQNLQKQNRIWIEVADPGIGQLKCTSLRDGTDRTGFVTLFNGEGQVLCRIDVNQRDLIDALKVVKIDLKYDYKQYTDKEVVVKHARE
ncbi:hypothetical protein HZB02_02490 [Candidatus Woesearchaeota archaeon]|nr:hypothetical protein [Candidatus Woesearchaeota archaeon]